MFPDWTAYLTFACRSMESPRFYKQFVILSLSPLLVSARSVPLLIYVGLNRVQPSPANIDKRARHKDVSRFGWIKRIFTDYIDHLSYISPDLI